MVGEPVKGSWWGHPEGNAIYNACNALVDHEDVMQLKLVKRKVTFVHRDLWPAVLGLLSGEAPWQTTGLTSEEKRLLTLVKVKGQVRGDKIPARGFVDVKKSAKELESRYLVVTQQEHSESGAHFNVYESWEHWRERVASKVAALKTAEARKSLEAAVTKIGPSRLTAVQIAKALPGGK